MTFDDLTGNGMNSQKVVPLFESSQLGWVIFGVLTHQLPIQNWSAQPWASINNNEQEDELELWESLIWELYSIYESQWSYFSFQPYAVDCWACGWPEPTISWEIGIYLLGQLG